MYDNHFMIADVIGCRPKEFGIRNYTLIAHEDYVKTELKSISQDRHQIRFNEDIVVCIRKYLKKWRSKNEKNM